MSVSAIPDMVAVANVLSGVIPLKFRKDAYVGPESNRSFQWIFDSLNRRQVIILGVKCSETDYQHHLTPLRESPLESLIRVLLFCPNCINKRNCTKVVAVSDRVGIVAINEMLDMVVNHECE